eukprot:2307959-Prymnesium_polylepis.1
MPALHVLLQAGAPLAMRDDRRQSALHTAARAGNCAALEALIGAGCELELRDRWHRTALHWAVVNAEQAAAAILIAACAVVNGVPMPPGKHAKSTSLPLECPLHSAARQPPRVAAPLIRLLLRAAADPNRADQFRQTPLHVAAAYSAPDPEEGGGEHEEPADAILELLAGGAVVDAADAEGRKPMDVANGRAIREVLEAGTS